MITCPVCKSYLDLELPQREDAQSEGTELGPSDAAACSRCLESRKLAEDALATLRKIKEKYGLGDRHVMREKNREIERLREALRDATELFGEIMRDEVNHQDEAEQWLRAYGEICHENRLALAPASK